MAAVIAAVFATIWAALLRALAPGSSASEMARAEAVRFSICELAADSELVLRTLGEHTFRRFIELKRQEWDSYRVQVTPFEIETFLPVL